MPGNLTPGLSIRLAYEVKWDFGSQSHAQTGDGALQREIPRAAYM